MSMFVQGLVGVTILFLVAACSVYPLPQDATGANTEDIVANVRCQARRAVRVAFESELERLKDEYVTKSLRGRDLLKALNAPEDGPRVDYRDLKVHDFVGEAAESFAYYATTQVGYEFTLDMKEQNTQGASIDLLRQFLRRADTIGIGVSADRTRQNSRNLRIQDTFLKLATGISHKYCEPKPGLNIVYPVLGSMPIGDLVRAYININEFSTLGKRQGGGFEGTKEGPAVREMADTIMFTTKFASKNDPVVDYHPAGVGFSVAKLSFTNDNSREDMHKVTILLSTTEKAVSGDGRVLARTVLPSAEDRRSTTAQGLDAQRQRNFEDAVINLSNGGIGATLF